MNQTVVFNPVLQPDAEARLMRGELMVKNIDLSFARPTNPDYFPEDTWNQSIFGALSEAGGVRMQTHISSDARSKDPEKHHLHNRVKRAMSELVGANIASVAKLEVSENDTSYPIDLVADRLFSKQDVEMDGRYPRRQSIYEALERARNDERTALESIFGVPGQEIT